MPQFKEMYFRMFSPFHLFEKLVDEYYFQTSVLLHDTKLSLSVSCSPRLQKIWSLLFGCVKRQILRSINVFLYI